MDATTRFDAVAPETCRIYLVRHGRTVMNTQVRFRGRLEVPLDEVGRQEAWDAAHGLSDANISAVYSSPLRRAVEVGEAITSVSDAGPVIPLPNLVNLDYGVWEGLTKEESIEHDPKAFDLYLKHPKLLSAPREKPSRTPPIGWSPRCKEIGERARQRRSVAACLARRDGAPGGAARRGRDRARLAVCDADRIGRGVRRHRRSHLAGPAGRSQ